MKSFGRVQKIGWMVVIFLALPACGNRTQQIPQTVGVYRPPTPAVTESSFAFPLQEAKSESSVDETRPSPTPSCTNNLWFLQDLTIPDGTQVSPGEQLDKRWLVQNNGSCNWNDQYQVRLIAGPGMGVPVQQMLYPALSGTDVVIRMVFIAPTEPGNYRSAWQAYDAQGTSFGDPFFIDIVVVGE
jgi:hypothetical protein